MICFFPLLYIISLYLTYFAPTSLQPLILLPFETTWMDLENFILHDLYVCLSASYFKSCFFSPALDLTLQDPWLLLYKLLLLLTFSSPSLYFTSHLNHCLKRFMGVMGTLFHIIIQGLNYFYLLFRRVSMESSLHKAGR